MREPAKDCIIQAAKKPPPPVVTLSSRTTFNQSSLKNDLALKKTKQQKKKLWYCFIDSSHGEYSSTAGAAPGEEVQKMALAANS